MTDLQQIEKLLVEGLKDEILLHYCAQQALALVRKPTCECKGTGMIDRPVWDTAYPNDGRDIPCPKCKPENPTDKGYIARDENA